MTRGDGAVRPRPAGPRPEPALRSDAAAEPIARRSSGDEAARYIRRAIFDGTLRPGARVPQDQVAEALGISRIPVREALIALEREGWVTIELHRGAFVSALDAQAVRDHYELFGLVYGFAATRALDRGADGLGDRLAELARQFAATDDTRALGRQAVAFHAAIVDAAASPRIRVVLQAMPGLVPGDFFALVPDAVAVERRGLAAIARAVQRHDGAQAAEGYHRMLRRLGEQVVRLFEARGLFARVDART
ncbi:MAG TPA: GntR family transcriptional regulator [Acidimicrobiia bacterium]|nr:GntR family transcriptional regulator [Acidimicrobiia bacterium]HEV3451636.1 GntR family transcriptional regulator [Acidimicrobiia bacterium]